MLAPILALALAAAPKLAVLPVAAGEGMTDKTAAALTEAVAAEVRRRSGAEVVTQRELQAVLGFERQKQMLGCATDACLAELGGALGVGALVTGDVAKLGESFLVHLRVVEVAKVRVTAQADRRLKGGGLDDVLDALPAMVAELFPGAGQPAAAAPPAPAATPSAMPAPPAPKLAPGWVEEPDAIAPAELRRLAVWQDDDGRLVATVPFVMDAPFYAGDARALHRVRLVGGSQEGESWFDRTFWEPRVAARWQAQFAVKGGGRAVLTCGDREIAYRRLGPVQAKRVLAKARLLAPRWRRIPHVLARDTEGMWFYVDGARRADGDAATPRDYRLWMGKKGKLVSLALDDVLDDAAGLSFLAGSGRLVVADEKAEWVVGATRLPVTLVDPSGAGPLIYRELGVYAGEALGTPCDGRL